MIEHLAGATALRVWCLLFFLVGLILPMELQGASEDGAYRIKASYIFNFLRYTTWQEDAGGELRIAVLSSSDFMKTFRDVEKQKVWDRRIKVYEVDKVEDLPEDCHIFVYIEENGNMMFENLPKGVLTITDQLSGIDKGAMLCFFKEKDRILFEINYSQVKESGINMSARLLKIAKIKK
jgi:hypothetical protein